MKTVKAIVWMMMISWTFTGCVDREYGKANLRSPGELPYYFAKATDGTADLPEKTNVPHDYRKSAIGKYYYTAQFYNHQHYKMDKVTGELEVGLSPSDKQIISFSFADGTFMTTSQIVTDEKGNFAFNLKTVPEVDEQGELVNLTGYRAVSLENQTYHGFFDASHKRIAFRVYGKYLNEKLEQRNFYVKITALKL